MHLTALPSTPPVTVAADVGAASIHFTCSTMSRPGAVAEWTSANRTACITATLTAIRELAASRGIHALQVIVEPTGIYHRLLMRIARQLGLGTGLVDGSHVTKMRSVVFGDDGKTDERDPYAIEVVAAQGRLIADRRLPETYGLLRQWGRLYHAAETDLIDAKCRIHRSLRLVFPDFAFSTDFLYSDSGRAIFRCYRFDPHAIARQTRARAYERLRKHSHIRLASVQRLIDQARQTTAAATEDRSSALLVHELELAWQDLERADARRQSAAEHLEKLYDEARLLDHQLPEPTGSAISKVAFARFLGEAGPLPDYKSWRQLLRMGGVNLRERKSGKYVGQTKITRKGRPLLRSIINQMALPLVKRGRLFGAYYHQKTGVQKMPGSKAMTAVGRKIVKMIWGWYRAGEAFDATRVFACAAEHRRAA